MLFQASLFPFESANRRRNVSLGPLSNRQPISQQKKRVAPRTPFGRFHKLIISFRIKPHATSRLDFWHTVMDEYLDGLDPAKKLTGAIPKATSAP